MLLYALPEKIHSLSIISLSLLFLPVTIITTTLLLFLVTAENKGWVCDFLKYAFVSQSLKRTRMQ